MNGAITYDVHPDFGCRIQGKDMTNGNNLWCKFDKEYLHLIQNIKHKECNIHTILVLFIIVSSGE